MATKKTYKRKSKKTTKETTIQGEKKELTVKWIVKDKKIIKFIEEEEKTYKLADNVLDYLKDIKANSPVNVTIDGDNVIYIAIKEGAKTETSTENLPPDEQPEPEVTPSEATYTVKGISKSGDWYLFEETGEKEWFGIEEDVKKYLEGQGVKSGDVLEIKYLEKTKKNKTQNYISFAKIKASKESEPKKETSARKTSYRDEDATDKRTAIMSAKDIVIALIPKGLEKKQIGQAMKDLSRDCYEALTEL